MRINGCNMLDCTHNAGGYCAKVGGVSIMHGPADATPACQDYKHDEDRNLCPKCGMEHKGACIRDLGRTDRGE